MFAVKICKVSGFLAVLLLVLLVLKTTILWTPQDTRSLKTANEVKVLKILFTKTMKKRFYSIKHRIPNRKKDSIEEKILFNRTQNSESKLVRVRSH